MTQTLDDVEQLVGLPADGDATIIGGTWGFLAILELEKVLNDGTAAAAKKKNGLTTRKPASANEHGDTPVHQYEDIAKQYDASYHEYASLSLNINLNNQQIITLNDQLQKLKEDKKESEANINLREAFKEKVEIELKRMVDEQCALEFADLPRQLDAKCKEIESIKAVNGILMGQIDMRLPPVTPEIWRQALKKALASEGMGDMGDPNL
ncbi:hypothetical protein GIB67_029670 [Kingdonia uniflora]|uniref:Uncharacterized protein n=1 Tax=Kingdonia uniflora TaxID=39325 RepID=A0A7J7LLF1_9MAGN|nr:hypothetical protein GIB67_029670 [Kingdonia uniflora]